MVNREVHRAEIHHEAERTIREKVPGERLRLLSRVSKLQKRLQVFESALVGTRATMCKKVLEDCSLCDRVCREVAWTRAWMDEQVQQVAASACAPERDLHSHARFSVYFNTSNA